MRCGCILVALTIACFVFGFVGLHESLANKSPATITYAEFIKKHPSEGWFIIKGCRIDVADAIYETKHYKSRGSDSSETSSSETSSSDATSGSKNEWLSNIWLPVHGVDSPEGEKVSLVLETMDPKIKQIIEDMLDMEKRKAPDAEVEKWVKAHASEMVIERDLKGMLQAGILADEKTKNELAKIDSTLNPDYMILDDDRRPPGVGKSIGLMFLGVILGGVTALFFFGQFGSVFNRKDAQVVQNSSQYGTAPPTIYAPYSNELPPVHPAPPSPSTPDPPQPKKGDDDFVV